MLLGPLAHHDRRDLVVPIVFRWLEYLLDEAALGAAFKTNLLFGVRIVYLIDFQTVARVAAAQNV